MCQTNYNAEYIHQKEVSGKLTVLRVCGLSYLSHWVAFVTFSNKIHINAQYIIITEVKKCKFTRKSQALKVFFCAKMILFSIHTLTFKPNRRYARKIMINFISITFHNQRWFTKQHHAAQANHRKEFKQEGGI